MLAVRRVLCGEDHPDVAASLFNIGVLYSKLGKYKLALEKF